MTTVANCFDLNEAHRLQMALDSAGIPSFIPDEASAGITPYHFLTPTGVRLMVADEHVLEAKKIIAEAKGEAS